AGVVLAHHADDQAETVLHRLLRSATYAGLSGMSPRAFVGDLMILRPLLAVDRGMLRQCLADAALSWRTDASNESPEYLRNRLRKLLEPSPALRIALCELADACGNLRDWARSAAPGLEPSFPAAQLAWLPLILAHESARQWLIDRGVPIDEISS